MTKSSLSVHVSYTVQLCMRVWILFIAVGLCRSGSIGPVLTIIFYKKFLTDLLLKNRYVHSPNAFCYCRSVPFGVI